MVIFFLCFLLQHSRTSTPPMHKNSHRFHPIPSQIVVTHWQVMFIQQIAYFCVLPLQGDAGRNRIFSAVYNRSRSIRQGRYDITNTATYFIHLRIQGAQENINLYSKLMALYNWNEITTQLRLWCCKIRLGWTTWHSFQDYVLQKKKLPDIL